MITCKAPETADEFEQYYQLRWAILRQPWQQPQGSERDHLEDQSCHRMLVDEHHNVIAVARLHKTSQHQAQIRYMAVDESYQGKGYGKMLLLALEQEAARQGVREITLNAREPALRFYQSLAYQNCGFSHLLYEQIRHFSMKKTLTPATEHLLALAQTLQQTWHQTMPLSKAMNMEVNYYNQLALQCSCDYAFNQNIHHTMFAGSIYTLATLSGWGWLYLQLAQEKLTGDIVLADADIQYLTPINGPAYSYLDTDMVVGNIAVIKRNKKARFTVKVAIYCGDKIAATFEGQYAILPKNH